MEHIPNARSYLVIWVILICMTALTAGLSYVDLGKASIVVALTIATFKGSLVMLYFMEARYISAKTTAVVIVAGFFWLLILLVQSMSDYATRAWS